MNENNNQQLLAADDVFFSGVVLLFSCMFACFHFQDGKWGMFTLCILSIVVFAPLLVVRIYHIFIISREEAQAEGEKK